MIQELRASCHKLAWGINPSQNGSEWNGTTLHPQRGRNSRVYHQQKKLWLRSFEEGKVLFFWFADQCTETLRKKSECWPLLSYHRKKCQNCCFCIRMQGQRNVCTAEAMSQFGWTVMPHPACCPDLAPSDFPCLFIWKTTCENTLVQMKRPCIMACSSGCRGRRRVHYHYSEAEEEDWQRWRLYWRITMLPAM